MAEICGFCLDHWIISSVVAIYAASAAFLFYAGHNAPIGEECAGCGFSSDPAKKFFEVNGGLFCETCCEKKEAFCDEKS